MARLTPALVEQIVSVLTINPDRCVVMSPDMTSKPRIVRDGRRWALHRYLYARCLGVDLPRALALLPGGCTTRGCINPSHGIVTSARGSGWSNTHCPNGHEYTPSNVSHGTAWKCVRCHDAWLARKRTTTKRRGYCRHGHKMTPKNVYRWVDAKGNRHRRCRRCQLDRQHAYRNRQKENR